MTLCQVCQRFDVQVFRVDGESGEIKQRGIPAFVVANGAKDGCNFCSLLVDSFASQYPDRKRLLHHWFHFSPFLTRWKSGIGLWGLKVRLSSLSSWPPWIPSKQQRIDFLTCSDQGSPADVNRDIVGPVPPADPLSEQSVAIIQGYLTDCIENHEACTMTVSGEKIYPLNSPLPTRCISISDLDSHGQVRARLEETLGSSGSYITLSHRWNAATDESKTTLQNYEDRKLGKQLILPKLFRDTLSFALKLSIKYVWIDSICIIQDGNDFQTESLKMAGYYQRSMFTLAAALDSVGNGLEISEAPSQLMPRLARLPYRDVSGQKRGYFYIYQRSPKLEEAFSKTVEASALLTRGWIFQEWFLSRRIICFASAIPGQRLFLHCQTGLPKNEFGDHVNNFDTFWGRPGQFQIDDPRSFWTSWAKFVERYSGLNLTKSDDRVIAFAGVATEFRVRLRFLAASGKWKRKFKVPPEREKSPAEYLDPEDSLLDAYVAGSWIRNIHAELLWEEDGREWYNHDSLAKFPTWSWASRMGPVKWRLYRQRHKFQKKRDGTPLIRDDNTSYPTCKLAGIVSETGDYYDTADSSYDSERSPLQAFDVGNNYSTLKFRGRLLSVIVRDHLDYDTPVDIRSLLGRGRSWHLSGLSRSALHNSNLRKVWSPDDPILVCGWASFEHPDFQIDESFQINDAFKAFSISTDWDHPGYIHNVIFVKSAQECGSEHFKRIGVGKIWGRNFKRAFSFANERDIFLC